MAKVSTQLRVLTVQELSEEQAKSEQTVSTRLVLLGRAVVAFRFKCYFIVVSLLSTLRNEEACFCCW